MQDEKRITNVLNNFEKFINVCDWLGRIPSAKSEIDAERKNAFWLIHMKQAKKGKSTCLWREELDDAARKSGIPELFSVDSRMLRTFDLRGQKIDGCTVIEKSERLSKLGQTLWICRDGNGRKFERSSYELRRIRDHVDYSDLIKESISFVGENIGCWTLLGFYDLSKENETLWFCSRTNGNSEEIKKISLPSFSIIRRFLEVQNGKKIKELVDPSVGYGVEDMTAQKIGRWTVIGFSHKASNSECVWYCVCDCGVVSTVSGGKLRNGCSMSCGCLRKDVLSKVAKDKFAASVSVVSA